MTRISRVVVVAYANLYAVGARREAVSVRVGRLLERIDTLQGLSVARYIYISRLEKPGCTNNLYEGVYGGFIPNRP